MSGPQFVHIETYARSVSSLRLKREAARAEQNKVVDRKLTVEEICGEAARLPGHCPHVDNAKAPILLHGISPDQVPVLLEERVAAANAAIRAQKAAMEKGTKAAGPKPVRSDTHVLLTIVASHPIPWRDEETGAALFEDPANYALLEKWQRLNIEWAEKRAQQLGFEVVSVVRHDDEAHPHLHFACIPTNERLDARTCHPGYLAKKALKPEEGEGDKPSKKRRDKAYSDAMRAFQDDYYESVSIDAGLLRTGPTRARVPRAVYLADKMLGRARGLASVRADQLFQENERTQQELDQTKELLATTGQEAVEAIIMVSDIERHRDALKGDIEEKNAEVRSLSDRLNEGDSLLADLKDVETALQKARDERSELVAQNDRIRADRMRDAEALRLQREELEDAKRKLADDKEKKEQELAHKRAALDAAQKELDAVADGIVAYAEGKLRYNPGNPERPFNLAVRRDGSDGMLKARLEFVKPRLVPIIQRLDKALSERASQFQKALTEAVAGWSTGLIEGVGEPRDDGRPTFLIPETPNGNRLLKAIEPFREAVAQVILALPDGRIVASVKAALARLQPRLAQAEQEEVRLLQSNLEHLYQQRSAELD